MEDITTLNAADIARSVRGRHLSAVEVTTAFLHRQDAINPTINAVVQPTHEAALARAAQIDTAVSRGEDPGLLCGVPVTIKVNVDQKGLATTNGLRVQKDNVAHSSSPFVERMEAQGAITIGRSNTPAFSLRWFTNNGLHGLTLNPRNPELTPGGSSGGAGAAVAAGLCAIGHGTDIAGSIRYPAYACGVHGLRPSFGRVPTFNATGGDRFIGGQVMAVSGPLARSIEDIDLALHAMSGTSPHDPWSVPAPLAGDPVVPRAALCLAPEGLAVATQVQDALLGAARALQDAGWQIDEVPCPPLREAADINTILWMAETVFAAGTAMADEGDAEAQFVYDQMCRDVGPIDLERVMHALKRRSALIRAWEQFFAQYPLMICPMSGELPFEQHLDIRSEAAFQRVYEAQLTQRALPVMGMPALSVATGMAGTHPNGVQLVAGRFREDIVLRAGKVVEAAFGAPSIAEPGQR